MLEYKSHKGWYKQSAEKCRFDTTTNRVLLPNGCCYQLGFVTNGVLLPTRCCYQPGVVTNRVLLPTGCCYQPVVVTNRVLLPTGWIKEGGNYLSYFIPQRGRYFLVYDNACNAHKYGLRRYPHRLRIFIFLIDRHHISNHTACSKAYDINQYTLKNVNKETENWENLRQGWLKWHFKLI